MIVTVTEWPGLKRTITIIEFQPPCYVQGRPPLDQAAQSHIQPGLECLQGWGIYKLLGQPVPVCHHPLGEKLLPNIQPKPPLSQFKTIPPCPITIHPCKQPFLLLFICSFQILEGHSEVFPAAFSSPCCTPRLLSLSPQQRCSRPLSTLVPSSGPAPTAPRLSCAGGPRPGRSTPDGRSTQHPQGIECIE